MRWWQWLRAWWFVMILVVSSRFNRKKIEDFLYALERYDKYDEPEKYR